MLNYISAAAAVVVVVVRTKDVKNTRLHGIQTIFPLLPYSSCQISTALLRVANVTKKQRWWWSLSLSP